MVVQCVTLLIVFAIGKLHVRWLKTLPEPEEGHLEEVGQMSTNKLNKSNLWKRDL